MDKCLYSIDGTNWEDGFLIRIISENNYVVTNKERTVKFIVKHINYKAVDNPVKCLFMCDGKNWYKGDLLECDGKRYLVLFDNTFIKADHVIILPEDANDNIHNDEAAEVLADYINENPGDLYEPNTEDSFCLVSNDLITCHIGFRYVRKYGKSHIVKSNNSYMLFRYAFCIKEGTKQDEKPKQMQQHEDWLFDRLMLLNGEIKRMIDDSQVIPIQISKDYNNIRSLYYNTVTEF